MGAGWTNYGPARAGRGIGTGGAAFGRRSNWRPGAGVEVCKRDAKGRFLMRIENEERERLKRRALDKLVALMDRTDGSGDALDFLTLNAANSVLNRLDGMPKQALDVNDTTPKPTEEPDGADEIMLRRLGAAKPADADG